jgi:subtilisin family serine protease
MQASSNPQQKNAASNAAAKSHRSFFSKPQNIALAILAVALIGIAVVWLKTGMHPSSPKSELPIKAQNELPPDAPEPEFILNQCIIKYAADASVAEKQAVREAFKAELKQELISQVGAASGANTGASVELIQFSTDDQVATDARSMKKATLNVISKISQDRRVLYAEPNYVIRAADSKYSSNDPLYVQGKLWGLQTKSQGTAASIRGQLTPTTKPRGRITAVPTASSLRASADKPIPNPGGISIKSTVNSKSATAANITYSQYSTHADQAWASGHIGSDDVYVGVVDSGIQYDHPDLARNFERSASKDFYNIAGHEELFSADENPHGTHVAGIIAAVGGNGLGTTGIAWKARIIEAKFLGSDGKGDTAAAVQAIAYLTDLKLKKKINIVAINASWVSYAPSEILLDAIKEAGKANILLIAAAGNESYNADKYKPYPASYDTSITTSKTKTPGIGYNSIISVAAIQPDGQLASFSNYGKTTVQLAAPGTNIWSTWPKNDYHADSGTSMAAPHVTGAALLYAASHPQASASEIRSAILSKVMKVPSLSGKVESGGTLDVSTF